MSAPGRVGAVVLAAGRSSRMGQAKMLLPWGDVTVLGQVVTTLAQAGVGEIVVVTGGAQTDVEALLDGMPDRLPIRSPDRPLIRSVYNPDYMQDAMILSLQAGLRALSDQCDAALIALGDQPQMEAAVVRRVLDGYVGRNTPLVVPSYQMRRGHPWLIARCLWPALLALQPPATTRAFLNSHAGEIEYVVVDSDTILRDLDTPEDYARERPDAALPPG